MEEGEISDQQYRSRGEAEAYDPSLEWPGSASGSAEHGFSTPPSPHERAEETSPCLRLVVLQSTILPPKSRLAIVDGYNELQIGRDVAPIGSTTPKLRLKEMQVSKLHATIYWDATRKEWGIVDMGSVHGTFVNSDSDNDTPPARLSPPRIASVPRRLRHLDTLTVGSSVFSLHVHADRLPCLDCSSHGQNEISLFPAQNSKAVKRSRDVAEIDSDSSTDYVTREVVDPKKALRLLKHSLLAQHRSKTDSDTVAPYLDRSARRRAMFPNSHPDSPGVAPLLPRSAPSSSPTSTPPSELAEIIKPAPPLPLPVTNMGHRLLMKQGWQPGTVLGNTDATHERVELVEPLELKTGSWRAGLGSVSVSQVSESDWKERGKVRRWEETRGEL